MQIARSCSCAFSLSAFYPAPSDLIGISYLDIGREGRNCQQHLIILGWHLVGNCHDRDRRIWRQISHHLCRKNSGDIADSRRLCITIHFYGLDRVTLCRRSAQRSKRIETTTNSRSYSPLRMEQHCPSLSKSTRRKETGRCRDLSVNE